MRLADFIRSNRERILAEWEAFARSCLPATDGMDIAQLRDHASEMLTVFAADLETAQSGLEQSQKSKGLAGADSAGTAATRHGADRAESGFTTAQMLSEYRALRASVSRLWAESKKHAGPDDLEDLTRFNEAIDQALAESITRYTSDLENSKEMFLAILGHDLRTPLAAVYASAHFILESDEVKEPHRNLVSVIAGSASRMNQMIGALLDFTRSRLGGGIPAAREAMNIGDAVRDVVDEISAAYPHQRVEVQCAGELDGEWDRDRLSQALTNLVSNALQHGSRDTAVRVDVRGEVAAVTIAIHNSGPAIPSHRLSGLFNPLKRLGGAASQGSDGRSANLGLGLYIADRIVNAHHGWIEVESSAEAGTKFTIHLPRDGVSVAGGTTSPDQ